MNSGVYVIEHIASGKKYVGSAARSISRRWDQHRHDLRKGTHHSVLLQRAWNKYGEDAFAWQIVKRTAPDEAVESEQAFIDLYQACDPKRGYNILPIAGSCRGLKHTAETRAKMSAARTGLKPTAETRAKMSAASKGHKRHTDATRAKISLSQKGRKRTAETLAKMSSVRIGVKREPFTAEHCANMSAALKGRKLTAEHRANMSAYRMGLKPSVETRARMSLAQKKRRELERTFSGVEQ